MREAACGPSGARLSGERLEEQGRLGHELGKAGNVNLGHHEP